MILFLGNMAYQANKDKELVLDEPSTTLEETTVEEKESMEDDSEASQSSSISKEESDETSSSIVSSESETDETASADESDNGLLPNIDFSGAQFKDRMGNVIKVKELKGKPFVINVWATWCPPCREEMPYFDTAWKKYKDQVDFYMVNSTESRPTETMERVVEFYEDMNLQVPLYFDREFTTTISAQASFLPTTVFVNEEGKVVYHHLGLISEQELNEQLEALLN